MKLFSTHSTLRAALIAALFIAGAACLSSFSPIYSANTLNVDSNEVARPSDFPEEKLNWHLSAQTYSFNRYTLVEAIEMAKFAGVKTIEVFGGQRLGGGMKGGFEVNMSAADKETIKQHLQDAGIRY